MRLCSKYMEDASRTHTFSIDEISIVNFTHLQVKTFRPVLLNQKKFGVTFRELYEACKWELTCIMHADTSDSRTPRFIHGSQTNSTTHTHTCSSTHQFNKQHAAVQWLETAPVPAMWSAPHSQTEPRKIWMPQLQRCGEIRWSVWHDSFMCDVTQCILVTCILASWRRNWCPNCNGVTCLLHQI